MALDSEISAVAYSGNGSTTVPYPVPFRYLDASHVRVGVKPSGSGAVETLLASTAYTVATDGVRTVAAVAGSSTVRVFRRMPLTQPLTLALAGALDPAAIERNFDRLVMQVQQIARAVDGTGTGLPVGGGDILQDTASFPNAAARLASLPKRVGQIGVQTDNQTIWIGQSLTAGDWSQFASTPTGEGTHYIAVNADCGVRGENQARLAGLLNEWRGVNQLEAAVFVGDNTYSNEAGFDDDWAAFDDLIAEEIVYPALGNHDIDGPTTWANHAARFTYLPGNRRYYKVTLCGGLVDLFVLHSGINTARTLVEPDGNTVGSAQHTWFVAQLAASKAKWKLVAFHHPFVTCLSGTTHRLEAMAWPELRQVHGIFCGHGHTQEWINWHGVPLVNVSSPVQSRTPQTWTLQGSEAGASRLVYAESSRRLATRLVVGCDGITVQFFDTLNKSLRYQRSLTDSTLQEVAWKGRPFMPDDPLAGGLQYRVGKLPRAMQCYGLRATVDNPIPPGESAIQLRLFCDGRAITDFTIPAEWENVNVDLNETFPAGIEKGDISIQILGAAVPYGNQAFGLEIELLGRWVS